MLVKETRLVSLGSPSELPRCGTPSNQQFCHPGCGAAYQRESRQRDQRRYVLFADPPRASKASISSIAKQVGDSAQHRGDEASTPSMVRNRLHDVPYPSHYTNADASDSHHTEGETDNDGLDNEISYRNSSSVVGSTYRAISQQPQSKGFPERRVNGASRAFILTHLALGLVSPTARYGNQDKLLNRLGLSSLGFTTRLSCGLLARRKRPRVLLRGEMSHRPSQRQNWALLRRMSELSSTGRTTVYSTYKFPCPDSPNRGIPSPSNTCTYPGKLSAKWGHIARSTHQVV